VSGRGRLGFERPTRRERDERGSMSVVVVLWSLVIVMVAALVVDGGLAISQRERAADLADQAARAEAQNIDQNALRGSGAAQIAPDACARAQAYLAAAASSIHYGTASIDSSFGNEGPGRSADGCELPTQAPGNSVTVSVHLTYSPFVYDLFGGTITVTETGTATATAATGG
jgi:Flp pilus assembly protein TadG